MDLIRPHGPAEFAKLATPLLLQNEVENGVMIGVADELARIGEAPSGAFWAVVMKGGDPVAAAMRTAAKLVVSTEAEKGATALIAADAMQHGARIVLGPAAEVGVFARAATEATGIAWSEGRKNRIYVLTEVTPAPPTDGDWRFADASDVDTMVRWQQAFMQESGEPGESDDVLRGRVQRRIRDRAWYVWTDRGQVVSMAAGVGLTPHGIRVGAVYTAPEARGRGYATALVAAVSQHMLDGGRSFVYLYTDLDNPTSNSIYQKIGYRPVADPLELRAETR
ncbi:MAG TPA: GNAT family N-acetyltransferase [Gemmatimonadaceae bacterium]|nr:GNAT family N-acetyltransferase [Gemmatimonadaceae bacterium]